MMNKPITVDQHDMPHIAMIATDEEGNTMAALNLNTGRYDMHDAVALGRRYVKRGCTIQIFTPKGE